MEKRKKLRAALEGTGICIAPGAHDIWSAKLIEKAGFPAVYMTGYGVSASLLGLPDIGLISAEEMTSVARNMASAIDIPLIADADTGFGSVLNAVRVAGAYEAAGVAAIQIEDQVFPKRCGHMEGKELIPSEEMVAKIKAIVKCRKDPDFLIIARTDARAVVGFEEAIKRAQLYKEAGADVIFLEAPTSREEMKQAVAEVDAPMLANMVNNGKTPFLRFEELQDFGFKLVIYPVVTLYTATKACMDNLALLKQGATDEIQDKMVDFPTFNELIGLEEIRDFEKTIGLE